MKQLSVSRIDVDDSPDSVQRLDRCTPRVDESDEISEEDLQAASECFDTLIELRRVDPSLFDEQGLSLY